ncbi:ATP-dependent DNA helicase [archaeon]|jgi:DNA excision repair protein ERCC-2|nr:ATP-dependent DNA helicase [archaeon]MBT3730676.1 ATP-dependent DNA helicase [archaeon]MBT4669578.1 ATP-dependent DNA helicase [archaeon]MBT5030335.1 ATP-dependent DNA helicase [archaeon]MBT5288372.1 ATP-dependent DNA helicase [archaeon]
MNYYFPYEKTRKTQENLMNVVHDTIKNKTNLLLHAPTGIGKTISALAPALTYILKEEPKKTIFFLTSRNTQHLIAVETLKDMKQKHNLSFVVVDLIGKKGMCNQSGINLLSSSEFFEYCKDLREKDNCPYFSNIKIKNKLSPTVINVLDKLKAQSPLHVEEINSICFNSDVCSYETACLLGKKSQVIIADYNYMLNPHIRNNLLQRINKNLSDCIIIFDEGHNIPYRARDILSSNLSTITLDYAAKETKSLGHKEISESLYDLKEQLQKLAKEKVPFDKMESITAKRDFQSKVEDISNYEELMGSFSFVSEQILETKRRSFTQSVALFMENWLGPDEGYTRILTKEFTKNGKVKINLAHKCLDPAFVMNDLIEESHSIIIMSGTLTPLDMYQDLLGFNSSNCTIMELENPFPQENRQNIILPKTSTKYKSRSKLMYEEIAKHSTGISNKVPGNVVIFFPSYKLRDEINEYIKDLSDKTIFLEDSRYTKEQRSDLLERFKGYKDEGAILLAVAGGSFSEGIDLPGDLLKAVIVVGLPLGHPNLETKELIDYYDRRFSRGWDYAYVFPAIIKTLQSAGRCIRSETDKGIIVFLDERYLWQSYRRCFPKEMNIQIKNDPIPQISDFFK